MTIRVYVLGGYQTDFARNWARDGLELFDLFSDTVDAGLDSTGLDPSAIESAHVGNFTAELFCGQGHLGGFFAASRPEFAGIPAACIRTCNIHSRCKGHVCITRQNRGSSSAFC